MKRMLQVGCVVLVLAVAARFTQPARTADTPAEKAAIKLFNSLTEEQKKQALLHFNDPERYKETFPPVKRKGLPYTDLNKKQIQLLEQAIGAMTSKYGQKRIMKLAAQGQKDRRYLTFYGNPGKGKFAWRLAQHHMTLVYVEFGKKGVKEFGPILLGGNPVGNMWDEEDQLFLKLYASLSNKERAQATLKKGNTRGILVGKLNKKSQALAKKLLNKRVKVFVAHYRKNFEKQLKQEGGVTKLYFGVRAKDATKSHHKGGKYYWRIAGGRILCDWRTQGPRHLHLTLKASPAKRGS